MNSLPAILLYDRDPLFLDALRNFLFTAGFICRCYGHDTKDLGKGASYALELLSSLVSSSLNQAATWSDCVASIPSVNFTPVMTLAK